MNRGIVSKLSEFLKVARKKRKLSQKEVSDALGLPSAQYLSNIEREGDQTQLAPKHFKKIAELYHADPRTIQRLYMEDLEDKVKKKSGIK